MRHFLWRLIAVLVTAVSLGLTNTTMAWANSSTASTGTVLTTEGAQNHILAQGDMRQFERNYLETTLALPTRMYCWGEDRTVFVSADQITLTWECKANALRQYTTVQGTTFYMSQGDKLVLTDGHMCIQTHWKRCTSSSTWFATGERDKVWTHRFTLGEGRWTGPAPRPRPLQVELSVTGRLAHGFHAKMHNNRLQLRG